MTRHTLSVRDRGWPLLLALVLVLATAVRGYRIGSHAFGTDEKTSLVEAHGLARGQVVNGPFTKAELEMHDNASGVFASNQDLDGGNALLYAQLLHIWATVFSDGPTTLRLLSLLFSVALIPVAYGAVRSVTRDRPTALVAATFCALSPLFLTTAQECRTYALATLLATLATWCFFRIVRGEHPGWGLVLTYAGCVTLSLFAHYSTAYIFLAHAALALLERIGRRKWTQLFAAAGIMSVIMVVWLLNGGSAGMAHIHARNAMYVRLAQEDPDINTFFNALNTRTAVQGALRQFMWASGNALADSGAQLRLTLLMLFVPATLVVLGVLRADAVTRRTVLLPLGILGISGTAYATVLALTSGHTVSYQSLYANFSAPWLLALIAACIVVLVRSTAGPQRASMGVLVAVQVVIMTASVRYVHLHHHVPTTLAMDEGAERIAAAADEKQKFSIVYGEPMTALLTNVYLPDAFRSVPQVVDTLAAGAIELHYFGQTAPEILLHEPLGTFRSMAAGPVPLR